jgi:hypothetical protein
VVEEQAFDAAQQPPGAIECGDRVVEGRRMRIGGYASTSARLERPQSLGCFLRLQQRVADL